MPKDRVYEAIKQQILTGHYKPGDLLSERTLLDEFKIGKTPLREVFFRLQHDGLIRRFSRVGTIVAPIDAKRLHDVAEIRHYLEGIVARLAVQRITEKTLEEMFAALIKLEDAIEEANINAFAEEENRLHSLLYSATGNTALKEFIEGQYNMFIRMWFTVDRTPVDLTEQLNHWKAICQALYDKDEEKAVTSNMKHFENYFNRLKSMR